MYNKRIVAENLWSGVTKIPQGFLGVCFHRWPGTSAKPTYDYGTWRCHDYDGCQWRDLHVGPSEFKWDKLDAAMAEHAKGKREVSYSMWGTPKWCSQKPDEPDVYGGLGGAAPPTHTSYVMEFLYALLNRYHGQIGYLECWNEPSLDGKGYWTGTVEQLVAMARACYEVKEAVDPEGVKCLGPSFSGFLEVPWFLNAADGVGGHGRDFVDAIAFHPYGTNLQRFPPLVNYSVGDGTAQWHDAYLRDRIVEGGLPRDTLVYGMEQAMTGRHDDAVLKEWPPEQMARYVAGVTALYAALGWQKVTWYSHDDDLFGNPSKMSIVSSALDWCNDLRGRTITSVDRGVHGEIRVHLRHFGVQVF